MDAGMRVCPKCDSKNNSILPICWKCRFIFDLEAAQKELLASGYKLTENDNELIFKKNWGNLKIALFFGGLAVVVLLLGCFALLTGKASLNAMAGEVGGAFGTPLILVLIMWPRNKTVVIPKQQK